MRKNPITGKMVRVTPKVTKVDHVEGGPIPVPVKVSETARVAQELADLRTHFASLDSGRRTGATGEKDMKKYRKLALEFWHLTGNHPPPIHADM